MKITITEYISIHTGIVRYIATAEIENAEYNLLPFRDGIAKNVHPQNVPVVWYLYSMCFIFVIVKMLK